MCDSNNDEVELVQVEVLNGMATVTAHFTDGHEERSTFPVTVTEPSRNDKES
ncbi:MAG TPA: hypothetical protein VHO25_20850 [Polyangiaceae bacterium]|nr:hypothetical protein [Polyangiaceae bacterium]